MKKHLQKYLFEEKVCNLVTEISSKETGAIFYSYLKISCSLFSAMFIYLTTASSL